MNNDLKRLKEQINKLPKKGKRVVAVALAIALAASSRGCQIKSKKSIYLVDLSDKYQNEATLTDINDKEIKIDTEDTSKLLAIVDTKKTKENNKYQAIIINENGKMIAGYMDGKYLEDKAIDKVEVTSNILEESNIVSAKSGLWLRDETKIDHNTDEAFYLENGTYIATSKITETSPNNSYMWKEAVHYDGEKLESGYVVSDYIINNDIEFNDCKKFIVNLENALSLKLRPEANTNCEPIEHLKNGQEVLIIPNTSSISDGTYDWLYVACKVGDEIKFGYVAATMYKDDQVINYLIEKEKSELVDNSNNKLLMKVVDTSSASNAELKLRETPGLEGNIISKLKNGTTIYTYQDLIAKSNETEEIDGHKWIKIYLMNGMTGYVASEYLKDKSEEYNLNANETTFCFGDEGTHSGYFGIDIKNTTSYTDFEKLITNDNNYEVKYNSKSNSFSEMKKPQFVMFKLGATGYANLERPAVLVESNITKLDNLKALTNICEEYQIPYGFYYYSQATNKEEIETEAVFIKNALDYLGKNTYNILPLAIDIEERAGVNASKTRVLLNAEINGKDNQTEIVNELMNRVRNDNNCEVILYTDHNSLKNCIEYQKLDKTNQQNAWIVDTSDSHSNDLAKNHADAVENISMRQIATDGCVGNVAIDVDFINSNYFEKLLKENSLIDNKQKIKSLTKN